MKEVFFWLRFIIATLILLLLYFYYYISKFVNYNWIFAADPFIENLDYDSQNLDCGEFKELEGLNGSTENEESSVSQLEFVKLIVFNFQF